MVCVGLSLSSDMLGGDLHVLLLMMCFMFAVGSLKAPFGFAQPETPAPSPFAKYAYNIISVCVCVSCLSLFIKS